jgi:hypothetical protein
MAIDWNSIIDNVGKSMISAGATLSTQSYLEARGAEKASNAVEKSSKIERVKLMAALALIGVLVVFIGTRFAKKKEIKRGKVKARA